MKSAQALASAASRALGAGDAATAETLLDELMALEGETLPLLQLRFRLARQRGDLAEALVIGRRASTAYPDSAPAWRMAATAAVAAADWAAADGILAGALERHSEDARLLELAVTVDRNLGRTPGAVAKMRRLADSAAEPHRWLVEIGKVLTADYQAEAGLKALQEAVSRGVPEEPLRVHMAAAAERAGLFDEAERAWTLHGEWRPSERDRVEEALRRIRARRGNPRAELVAGLEDLQAFRPPGARAAAASTRSGDVAVWREPGSDACVLFFGSISPMMGVTRPQVPSPVVARRANGVALADPRRLLTLAGVPSLGADYAETLAALRSLLQAWGIARTYVAGLSAGGYPALRYGLDLGASRILLLSPGLAPPQGAGSPLAGRLLSELGDIAVDARALVEARGARTPIVIAHADGNESDRWQAARLAGLPNVEIRAIPGSDHFVGQNGYGDSLYAELLEVPAGPPPRARPQARKRRGAREAAPAGAS